MSTAAMDIATKPREVTSHVSTIDWSTVSADLNAQGWAVLPKLLSANECDSVAARYDQDAEFRSHVIMARHGFGRGEYKYFAYPLPSLVEELRTDLYPLPLATSRSALAASGGRRRAPLSNSLCHDGPRSRASTKACSSAATH